MDKIINLKPIIREEVCDCGGSYKFRCTSRDSHDGSRIYIYECKLCHKELPHHSYHPYKFKRLRFLDESTGIEYGLIGEDLHLMQFKPQESKNGQNS